MIVHSGAPVHSDTSIEDVYSVCEHKEMEGIETVDDRLSDAAMIADDISPSTNIDTSVYDNNNNAQTSYRSDSSSFLHQILTGQGYRNDFLAMGEIFKVRHLMNNSFNMCISNPSHVQNDSLTSQTVAPSQELILDSRFTIQPVEKYKKVKYRTNLDMWNSFDRFGE